MRVIMQNPGRRAVGVIFVAMVVLAGIVAYIFWPKDQGGTGRPPILRVGWMTSWATAGQIVEALRHAAVPKDPRFDAEYHSFLFGPPMNEAALAGDLHITVVGDMPAISLLARSDDWVIIGRSIYFPYALMVRTDVAATTVADLRGKKVAVPFGSGPQPTLLQWLGEASLISGTDVTVIHVAPNEMAEAVRTKQVDALMTWEPTIAVLEGSKLARVLRQDRGVGFLIARKSLAEAHPDAITGFLDSWRHAIAFVGQNAKQANAWFATDSRIPVETLERIQVVEPAFAAATADEINLTVTKEDLALNQKKADFALREKLIPRPLILGDRTWPRDH